MEVLKKIDAVAVRIRRKYFANALHCLHIIFGTPFFKSQGFDVQDVT